jgi:uncharacterized protein (DUF58 family)
MMVGEGSVSRKGSKRPTGPVLKKGNFQLNFPKAIGEFEAALRKFPVKNILYSTLFQGRGLEFDSYREFLAEDDADMIDWKASLRANTFLVRKYVQEGDLNVYFLVDVSNSMLFGSGSKLKSEYAAEMVCALAHLIVNSGDNIGLVMFNDGVVKYLHPASGKNQFALFMKYLSDPNLYGGDFDLESVVHDVIGSVKSSYSVFILVSDFIKIRKGSDRILRLLGSRFETISIMIRDVLDESLPDTKYQFALQDPYSGRQMILDPDIAAEKYRLAVARQKGHVKDMLKHSKVDLLELSTSIKFSHPTAEFLKSRAMGARV